MNKKYAPQFPIYIISKGRWESRLTVKALEEMQQPFFIVVEEQEYSKYAGVIDKRKILVLDKKFQDIYDTCEIGEQSSVKGSGPARNFCWEHSLAAGHKWHWLLDDNISHFFRSHAGQQLIVKSAAIFTAMEDFTLRFTNVKLAGPYYYSLSPRRQPQMPFTYNKRVFSCLLIDNSLPFRWRARYNEDADLSLRVLKTGYCTLQFNVFLQRKLSTQSMPGGNTDVLYANGTKEKAEMLYRLHPDCVKLVYRYSRHHHLINYSQFLQVPLVNPMWSPQDNADYGMNLKKLKDIESPELQAWFNKHILK